MKILLDENIPKGLRLDFGGDHRVFTARQMGWNGKKNGELLGLLTRDAFEVLITMDKNIEYQQNLERYPIAIILLKAERSNRTVIQPLIPQVLTLLKGRLKRGILTVERQKDT